MITVDQLLLELSKKGIGSISNDMPSQDKRILISLSRQLTNGNFLTKNQGNLLVKILKENEKSIRQVVPYDKDLLQHPLWSENFRVIHPIRKIYRKKDNFAVFYIEFNHNKRISSVIPELNKSIDGFIKNIEKNLYSVFLTERNIQIVVEKLRPFKFEISEEILDFYREIQSIQESRIIPKEIIFEQNKFIKDSLLLELTKDKCSNLILLADRQIRYQYKLSENSSNNSLLESIAFRNNHKVWLSNSNHNLIDLVSCLSNLDRFPLLCIIDSHNSDDSLDSLIKLTDALKSSNIDDIRIYFRFDNKTESMIQFNQFISKNNFNQTMTSSTKVVVLSNNQLPKFLFKTNWYPRSVITFTNNFRNTKTSVWVNAVDLQIFYTKDTPMIGGTYAVL